MLKCQSPLQEDLKAYLDSELAPVRHAAVAKHLTSCPACQSELAALRLLSTQLTETLPATEPLPDALRARILAALPEKSAPRPFSLAFWWRPGPMAAFGGTVAMGCAFLLWLRVPESDKASAPSRAPEQAQAQAKGAAPAAPMMVSKAVEADKAPASAAAAPPPVAIKEEAESPVANAPLPTPFPFLGEKYAAEFKSDGARSQPLSAPQPPVTSQRSIAPAKPRTDVLIIPEPGTPKAETDTGSPSSASVADRSDMKKATLETKPQDSSQQLKAMTTRRAVMPASYTLTIAAGKRAETLETIHKLAEELAVTVGDEQPDLSLRLAPDRREVLLERLKALGALVETPPVSATDADNMIYRGGERSAAPNSQQGGNQGGAGRGAGQAGGGFANNGATGGGAGGFGGFGGGASAADGFGGRGGGAFGGRGGGGFGGAAANKPAPAAKVMPPPQLRLTLVIKESEPKKESERKELP